MAENTSEKEILIVTGSSGLVGSRLIERLSGTFHIMGLDRNPPSETALPDHAITCDFGSDRSVTAAFAEVRQAAPGRIASVIHLASYYDFTGKPHPLYEQVNIGGSERLLEALADFEVEQFVFSSTMLVHAPTIPGKRIDESSPLKPAWSYPGTSHQVEKQILENTRKMPAVILRLPGIYDDHCRALPLAHQIRRIHKRSMTSRLYPGKLSSGQAYLHLEDLVEALKIIVERRKTLPPETILLLGEEEVLSYGELQDMIAQLLHGERWTTRRVPKAIARAGARAQENDPEGDPFIRAWMVDHADDHYALDTRRSRELLEWKPRRSLRETLPRMIASLKEDPESWRRENGIG